MRMILLGIDPGAHGGLARLTVDGIKLLAAEAWKLPDTELMINKLIRDAASFDGQGNPVESVENVFAFIEHLHALPARVRSKEGAEVDLSGFRGSVSSFNLGQSYGFLRGCLTTRGINFQSVVARSWQTALGCRTKGNKNISKNEAIIRFPQVPRITHMTADALLIAEWGRRFGNWATRLQRPAAWE